MESISKSEKKVLFLGIDPGQTGGAAIVNDVGSLIKLCRFDGADPLDVIKELPLNQAVIILELVHSYPDQGLASTFAFGMGYGRIQGWLYAHNLKFECINPQTWQRYLPVAGTAKERVRMYCNRVWGEERFIFPRCRVPHQGAMDAACMAEFARRLDQGSIQVPKPQARAKKLAPIRL